MGYGQLYTRCAILNYGGELMGMFKQELYMTAYRFKEQEDARHREDEQKVIKLFIKHKQEDLLPMLGLENPNG